MKKVVIGGRVPAAGKQIIHDRCRGKYEVAEVLTPEELDQHLDGAYYILRGTQMGTAEVNKLGPQAKLLHRWGVGYDSVDIETAGKRAFPWPSARASIRSPWLN